MFQLLRALARKDWASAASMVIKPTGDEDAWTPERFANALAPFFEEHTAMRLDPSARSPANTRVTAASRSMWDVGQVICDVDGDDDWLLSCQIDLEASARESRPVVVMRAIAR
jgi:hypothetical protein